LVKSRIQILLNLCISKCFFRLDRSKSKKLKTIVSQRELNTFNYKHHHKWQKGAHFILKTANFQKFINISKRKDRSTRKSDIWWMHPQTKTSNTGPLSEPSTAPNSMCTKDINNVAVMVTCRKYSLTALHIKIYQSFCWTMILSTLILFEILLVARYVGELYRFHYIVDYNIQALCQKWDIGLERSNFNLYSQGHRLFRWLLWYVELDKVWNAVCAREIFVQEFKKKSISYRSTVHGMPLFLHFYNQSLNKK
jgi:hypothetical protein